jgi:hypothetical protein
LVALRSVRPWPPTLHIGTTPLSPLVGDWAMDFGMLAPIGVGAMLADRGRRESRLHLDDLLWSTPTGFGPRWWGKAVGASAATITPVLVAWLGLLGYLTVERGPGVIGVGLGAFAAAILPGLILVSAMSITVPLLIGAPLYRLAFIAYWFWGNLVGPSYHIPTLSGTPFEALGEYPVGAWFHGSMFDATDRNVTPTTADALLNIVALLVVAAATLIIAQIVISKRSQS